MKLSDPQLLGTVAHLQSLAVNFRVFMPSVLK